MPTNALQFGDGYAQRTPDGLNRASEIWNVECQYNTGAEDRQLQDFLDTVGGWQEFLWQSPRDDTPQTYVVVMPVAGATKSGEANKPLIYTRNIKLKRVWNLSVPIPTPKATTYLKNIPLNFPFASTYLVALPLTNPIPTTYIN